MEAAGRLNPAQFSAACGVGLYRRLVFWLAALVLVLQCSGLQAQIRFADPDDYMRQLRQLRPGDRLLLAPGRYTQGLRLHDVNGTAERPIEIEGPADGRRAVFVGRPGHNVISIKNASHVLIRNLEIDGQGAFVDAVKAEGHADYAHHITLENLYIHNFAKHQQAVGISTKCPAWDWVVRGNRIEGVGTGMYFGNSDGSAPFFGGLIEDNQVLNTIGYNLQIKHQRPRPAQIDIPVEPRQTIIRRNLFVKEETASEGPAARPNVLVGHFPLEGPGKDDEYVIYGNLFFQNPNEALFQGEGNIALYSNLFFNSHKNEFPAVAIQPHNDIPRRVRVFFNTVVAPGQGIRVLRKAENWIDGQVLINNAVFAEQPLQGGVQVSNFTADFASAAEYLMNPEPNLRHLNLTPRPGVLLQERSPMLPWTGDLPEAERDIAGSRRSGSFLGAFDSDSSPRTGWPVGEK